MQFKITLLKWKKKFKDQDVYFHFSRYEYIRKTKKNYRQEVIDGIIFNKAGNFIDKINIPIMDIEDWFENIDRIYYINNNNNYMELKSDKYNK